MSAIGHARDNSEPAAILSRFFIYPLELLHALYGYTELCTASGKPVRPSCLPTVCLILTEGASRLPLPIYRPH